MTPLTLLALAVLALGSAHRPVSTHEIILSVDTENLNQQNLDESCTFGQDADISNEDFTLEVQLGDVVIWKGVSSSNPDTDEVQIVSINHEGGARVFDKNRLQDTRENPGVVQGTVTQGKAGDEEKYKVSFRVFRNGEKQRGTYNIDPKLRITN